MTLPELSAQLSDPNNRKRIIDITAILSVVAIALIVGSETLFTSFALVWAVTSQMHLAPLFSYPLFAAALIVALGATGFLARLAWQSETDPANR
ncbi:hypothetical protein V0U79_04330 [Hyphobacterium sp. HN65]|uniref:Uncharacterized protein n=1 Tax=Hyphobacterium lacteum TaxID=3116575 RepID=A0ABU7LNW5_9PROT|nr:hypothetical protein [Hyphobacterium sp. HN65]MEE2525582.1 hypothetical protein [Hyphobacterium sp. HN65]